MMYVFCARQELINSPAVILFIVRCETIVCGFITEVKKRDINRRETNIKDYIYIYIYVCTSISVYIF